MSYYCPGCGRTDMAGITHVCPPLSPPVVIHVHPMYDPTPAPHPWGSVCFGCPACTIRKSKGLPTHA